ncbi:hypothetical protein NQ317_008497 [Molorchus minor]|uniref:SET domain-containing protein n=1 Tax=Molorchus minor TaxID=1323400 RepID=A0ABQ9JLT1_9CUCU|nr:hypothetical protein NQ317_008497 [Molorchus minor]
MQQCNQKQRYLFCLKCVSKEIKIAKSSHTLRQFLRVGYTLYRRKPEDHSEIRLEEAPANRIPIQQIEFTKLGIDNHVWREQHRIEWTEAKIIYKKQHSRKRLLNDQTCNKCPGCFWPVCKTDCEGLKIPTIHGFECSILRLRPPSEAKSFLNITGRFDVIIILRALYLQKADSQKWETMLNLQDHLKQRGPNTKVYKSIQEKIQILEENYLTPLRNHEKETGQSVLPQISHDTINRIYGILDVNGTELAEDRYGIILYPTASLLEHNCTPNTIEIIDEKDNFKVTYRAALPIKRGDTYIRFLCFFKKSNVFCLLQVNTVTSIYTQILWGTSARRHDLKKTKYFVCKCKRCQDPTELGTYMSALRCLGTEQEFCGGTQLPVNPTESNCEWVCNKCCIRLPNKDVMNFLISCISNHYLIYPIKHSLVQLYGKEVGIEISNQLLEEKQKLCEQLIDISRKLDPGNVRLSLYFVVLLNELFFVKFKKKKNISEAIKEILTILDESKEILEYERNSTAGSKLYEVVCQNETYFRNWIETENLTFLLV